MPNPDPIAQEYEATVRGLAGADIDHVDTYYNGRNGFSFRLQHGESSSLGTVDFTSDHWQDEIKLRATQVLQAEAQRRLDLMRQERLDLGRIPYQGQFLPPTEFTAEFRLSAQDYESFRDALGSALPRDHRKKAAPKPNTRKTFWDHILEED